MFRRYPGTSHLEALVSSPTTPPQIKQAVTNFLKEDAIITQLLQLVECVEKLPKTPQPTSFTLVKDTLDAVKTNLKTAERGVEE